MFGSHISAFLHDSTLLLLSIDGLRVVKTGNHLLSLIQIWVNLLIDVEDIGTNSRDVAAPSCREFSGMVTAVD